MKAIRNTFAHSKIPLTFNHDLIEREVLSMSMGSAIRKEAAMRASSGFKMSNRQWFMLTIRLLLILIEALEESPKSADHALDDVMAERDRPLSEK